MCLQGPAFSPAAAARDDSCPGSGGLIAGRGGEGKRIGVGGGREGGREGAAEGGAAAPLRLHRPRRRITAGLGVPLPCPPPRRWLQVNHGVGGDGAGGWRELDGQTWPRWEVPMGRGGPGARWSRGAASPASVSPGDAGSRWARFAGAGSGQAGGLCSRGDGRSRSSCWCSRGAGRDPLPVPQFPLGRLPHTALPAGVPRHGGGGLVGGGGFLPGAASGPTEAARGTVNTPHPFSSPCLSFGGRWACVRVCGQGQGPT